MRIVPGDVVATQRGWSISKLNRTMHALGGTMGNNLLVVAVRDDSEEAELCVLTEKFGPVWVHNDDRFVSVVK